MLDFIEELREKRLAAAFTLYVISTLIFVDAKR